VPRGISISHLPQAKIQEQMSEERLKNLYRHSRMGVEELKQRRLNILKGDLDYGREESNIRVRALSSLIREKEAAHV
jgi:hypothetical protein